MFNSKLANQLLKQAPNQLPQLDQFDLEAERQGNAVRFAPRPNFKGKRLLNKAPSRQSKRIDTYG